jgi:phosphopantetheinyl transferase/malonyl CoA-acyl carrier protein transacylase
VYSCSTAAAMPASVAAIRSLAVEQWVRPVDFRATVEAMHADGVRLFVEVGARGNLAGYVEDILRGRPHFAVAANLPRRSGLTQLNHLVASLYAQGVAVRPEALYVRRRPRPVDLGRNLPPPRPVVELALGFPEMSLSKELAARLASRRHVGAGAPGADGPHAFTAVNGKPSTNGHAPVAASGHVAPIGPGPAPVAAAIAEAAEIGDANLLDHFQTMDLFLETQRQVMDAYLTAPGRGAGVTAATMIDRGEPARLGAAASDQGLHANPTHSSPAQAEDENEEPIGPVTAVAPDVCQVLLDRVSRRTGYPREMLDLGYDMEADLGIDSIKRVEILGELQALGLVPAGLDLERLSRCRTLGDVVALLEPKPAANAPAAASAAPPPWPGTVETFVAGREFVGTWPLDAATDPVAWHHTLGGRRLSAVEPGRLGLPVVPFTIMAEMLAQAAAVLAPGLRVLALRDVQASRWVPYEAAPSELELRATCDPARPGEVRVALRPRGGRRGEVAFEGLVVFAAATPEPPPAAPLELDSDRLCRHTADELYRDQWLFHGPPLQALTWVGRSCPSGIEGTLTVLPHNELLPTRLWPALHTDPIVLDAFTHLLGCWGIDRQAGEEGSVMFPLRVAEIRLFGTQPDVATAVDCRIRVRDLNRHRVRVDADLVTPDGRVWVRITGWEDWRFYWPDRYRDVFRAPDTMFAGEPLALEGHQGQALAVWLEPPADMGKPVWRDVLEWVQLGPEERAANRARGESEPGLTLRIWGRVAAKEAARRLRSAAGEPPVYPADLTIESDPAGQPLLRSLAEPQRDDLPAVSIAHTEGVAVAAARLDPAGRIGVDVERVRPLGDEFEASALLDPERRWLDDHTTSAAEREEWVARLWCCKEAAAKATGLGMIAGPASVVVVDADRATGRAVATLGDVLATRCPDPGAAPLVCHTERRGEYVWAWTTFERSDR